MQENADRSKAAETSLAEKVSSCITAPPRFVRLSFDDNMRMQLLSPCRALQVGLCFHDLWVHDRVDASSQKRALAEFAFLFSVAATLVVVTLIGRSRVRISLSRACACIPMCILFLLHGYTFWNMLSWVRRRAFANIQGFEVSAPCLFFACWIAIALNVAMWPRTFARPEVSRWIHIVSAIALALGQYWLFDLDSAFAIPFLWASVTGGTICLFFAMFPTKLSRPVRRT